MFCKQMWRGPDGEGGSPDSSITEIGYKYKQPFSPLSLDTDDLCSQRREPSIKLFSLKSQRRLQIAVVSKGTHSKKIIF